MSSLLDSLKDRISPDVVRGLASNLGESTDSVQRALQTSSAAMLTSLASKAQDSGFLSQIMNLISSSGVRGAMGAAAGAGKLSHQHRLSSRKHTLEPALRRQFIIHPKQDRRSFGPARIFGWESSCLGRTDGPRHSGFESDLGGSQRVRPREYADRRTTAAPQLPARRVFRPRAVECGVASLRLPRGAAPEN